MKKEKQLYRQSNVYVLAEDDAGVLTAFITTNQVMIDARGPNWILEDHDTLVKALDNAVGSPDLHVTKFTLSKGGEQFLPLRAPSVFVLYKPLTLGMNDTARFWHGIRSVVSSARMAPASATQVDLPFLDDEEGEDDDGDDGTGEIGS